MLNLFVCKLVSLGDSFKFGRYSLHEILSNTILISKSTLEGTGVNTILPSISFLTIIYPDSFVVEDGGVSQEGDQDWTRKVQMMQMRT